MLGLQNAYKLPASITPIQLAPELYARVKHAEPLPATS